MNITLEGGKDEKATVSVDGKPSGVIKVKSGHFLCYSNGRHTTTQSLEEVIRFFNGDYGSYYYRQRE